MFSLLGLILLMPVFLVIMIVILVDSRGGAFFMQTRVGKGNREFKLLKFRTMRTGSEKTGGLTIGVHDSRITKTGYFLRKFKLDELPQFLNVFIGDMSLVGPRPEIRKYVDLYSGDQLVVLSVKPGITDYASIEFMDENAILGRSPDPEQTYITEIMPAKIAMNMQYIQNYGAKEYFAILFRTLAKIIGR